MCTGRGSLGGGSIGSVNAALERRVGVALALASVAIVLALALASEALESVAKHG